VRTAPSFWRTVRSWFQQLWQRFCTPQATIQPPLQPKRQKPFPQRPHHRRRQAVFAALATAAPDATIAALIAHVRAVTGTGCSRKLILAWRQAREKDTANERHGDAATVPARNVARRRIVQLRLFLLCVFVGATIKPWLPATSVTAQEIVIAPAPDASPTPFPSPAPRLLRIQLTLQAPHELRIKVGDEVQAGEVLSDQRQARQRLLMQKRALESVAQHLQSQCNRAVRTVEKLTGVGLRQAPYIIAAGARCNY
jgi:predicted secreted protein